MNFIITKLIKKIKLAKNKKKKIEGSSKIN